MKTLLESDLQSSSISKRSIGFLLETIRQSKPYVLLKKALQEQKSENNNFHPINISGFEGSLPAILVAVLFADLPSSLMVLSSQHSEIYEHDFNALLPAETICNTSDELSLSIGAILRGDKLALLSFFEDLNVLLCTPSEAKKRILQLKTDQIVGYATLQRFLATNGFEQREFVEDEGEFSIRGSIIDVFSFGYREPLRIEFFGDTVTSLRNFDINSQLSGKKVTAADLTANFTVALNTTTGTGSTILNYLDPSTIIIIDDTTEFAALENNDALSSAFSKFRCIRILRSSSSEIDFQSVVQKKLNANFRVFATLLQEESNNEKKTLFATSSRKEIGELTDFLTKEIMDSGGTSLRNISWLPLNLHTGFTFGNLDLYTESDIFGKLHIHKAHKKRKIRGISLKDLQKLKIGDYVVHEDYGIGIFRSLETITVGNSEQESVLIEYEGGDQLFVNVQNINLLSKYTASEGSMPSLSKLGSSKWATKKEKVRNKIRDIAINLIKIYAQRKMEGGFAFGTDSIFMREFEASFIFEETPDQLRAIEDVRKDMEEPHPMDRLICGDAGFGKTEIAMRAAFKAVESKKQVAILTPTTILAHQHGESFTRRFENFPISIAVLSRFISHKEQLKLLTKVENGHIDIVIGTHRLVSKDVQFKDLGLLVIDEEQHFGVEVKEKLREQFPHVDTLTMSATPIPRTLQFSMLGARDLSIVSTPPINRQPVETIITDYDISLIQSAICKEIQREGQVFFLHNRISGLEEVQKTLRELVPSARIVVAHGQMPSKELEKVMIDFIEKEVDVLISTTIIGSGLDISNANTIIINRADMFGLSDLYQLRGRVGRSERKAYCYLITPPLHTLKKEAIQRLAVIENFTELGSGFNIALRDLDIRGAGNLLGAEQSGSIYELGFDLYQKMLEETVAELKSTTFSHLFSTDAITEQTHSKTCDLLFFFNALIPDYYIHSTLERFSFYNKISKASSEEDIDTLTSELQDRFGTPPEEVSTLLLLTKLKLTASALGLEKIDIQQKTFTILLPDQDDKDLSNREFYQYLFLSVQESWMQEYKPGFRMDKKIKLVLQNPSLTDTSPIMILQRYTELLKKLDRASKDQCEISCQ